MAQVLQEVRQYPMRRFTFVSPVISFTLCLLCLASTPAQTRPSSSATPPPLVPRPDKPDSDDKPPMGTIEEEMRIKRELKYKEKEYEDNLERARKLANLGAQIRDSYKQNRLLNREDTKKLDLLEKLARRIRSEAGGSDEDVSIESPPQQLEPALSRLAEESDCLKTSVEKTPRQVVSAMVIEKANVLLKLIKLARGFLP